MNDTDENIVKNNLISDLEEGVNFLKDNYHAQKDSGRNHQVTIQMQKALGVLSQIFETEHLVTVLYEQIENAEG